MGDLSSPTSVRPMRRIPSDVDSVLDSVGELPADIVGSELPTQRSILEDRSNENEGRTN